MGRVEGKVAFITGAARGQGRSHAIRLAEEGADIIAVDLCADVDVVRAPLASPEDLAITVKEVEARGRRIVAVQADVRDTAALQQAFDRGRAELGHVDVVVANAGIGVFGSAWEFTEEQWQTTIDINLTGVWHTTKVAIPTLLEQGTGGSIVITGSVSALKGAQHSAPYSAAKHALVGLVRTLALELATARIRVNGVHPTSCNTPMIHNPAIYELFRPDLEHPTLEDCVESFARWNLWDEPWIEPVDVSNAVLWLASDESRYVTGIQLPIDLGNTL